MTPKTMTPEEMTAKILQQAAAIEVLDNRVNAQAEMLRALRRLAEEQGGLISLLQSDKADGDGTVKELLVLSKRVAILEGVSDDRSL